MRIAPTPGACGHYALGPVNIAKYPAADIVVEHIGDLLDLRATEFFDVSTTEKS